MSKFGWTLNVYTVNYCIIAFDTLAMVLVQCWCQVESARNLDKLKMDKRWQIYSIFILFCILNVESGIPIRSANNTLIQVHEKRSINPVQSPVENSVDIIQQ